MSDIVTRRGKSMRTDIVGGEFLHHYPGIGWIKIGSRSVLRAIEELVIGSTGSHAGGGEGNRLARLHGSGNVGTQHGKIRFLHSEGPFT